MQYFRNDPNLTFQLFFGESQNKEMSEMRVFLKKSPSNIKISANTDNNLVLCNPEKRNG